MKRSSLCRKLKGQRNPVRTHHQVFVSNTLDLEGGATNFYGII